jgi:hypothetical protein
MMATIPEFGVTCLLTGFLNDRSDTVKQFKPLLKQVLTIVGSHLAPPRGFGLLTSMGIKRRNPLLCQLITSQCSCA